MFRDSSPGTRAYSQLSELYKCTEPKHGPALFSSLSPLCPSCLPRGLDTLPSGCRCIGPIGEFQKKPEGQGYLNMFKSHLSLL